MPLNLIILLNDGQVVCHQLGFYEAESADQQAGYGQGTGPIHLDNVQCRGDETDIMRCSHNGVGINNCNHAEDAGVSCRVAGTLGWDLASLSDQ